ncbi:MAG: DUF3325 domain-containing protein [Paraburkholderia sp.]|uniref:DUF3325 domain-containing protein n=1 Tax=Paraburkholderia sp. TaxID=1926495 RepID=UPI0011F46C5B|nr:MAG: DUF3325 domain-containing protein [Paraburkholderia sp.]
MPIYVLFYVLFLCVLAFACLALAMVRHQEAVFGKALTRAASRVFRGSGWSGRIGSCAGLTLFCSPRMWS